MRMNEEDTETGELFEVFKGVPLEKKSEIKSKKTIVIKKEEYFKSENELMALLKRATQVETLIYSPHSTFATTCVLEEDYEILNYVFDELLPQIGDLKVRVVVWSRAYGICWKLISRELEISETQCKRLYQRGIEVLMNGEKKGEIV